MNEFTLFKALNILKSHLLVTIALFMVIYWTLPSQNFIDNKYTLTKIIKPGFHHRDFDIPLLNFKDINGIILSPSFYTYLSKETNGSGVASFKIEENDAKNISITFKSDDKDIIINTANVLMKNLIEFDEAAIQITLEEINETLNVEREILKILLNSNTEYQFTDQDLEEWSKRQKDYDLTIDDMEEFNQKYKLNLISLMRFKADDTSREVELKKEILLQRKLINKLELIKNVDFKPVSYLYPVSKNDISKYYPNTLTYFGISLLVVFLYNLILLIYKFRQRNN